MFADELQDWLPFFKVYTGVRAYSDLRVQLKPPNYVGHQDLGHKSACDSVKSNNEKFAFLARTIVDWNSLPTHVFDTFPANISIFNRRVKLK